jgi:hypothetical protein
MSGSLCCLPADPLPHVAKSDAQCLVSCCALCHATASGLLPSFCPRVWNPQRKVCQAFALNQQAHVE